MLADQEHPDDTGKNREDSAEDALDLQDTVTLRDVIRQRDDHGVHRDLHERIGKVVEQIGHRKPCELHSLRRALRHQEENHREDREKEEGGPVPGEILPFTGQLPQQLAVLDVQLVDEEAENHVVAGVNDLDHQDGR